MSETLTTVQIQKCLDRMHKGETAARDELMAVANERLRLLSRRMLHDYPGVHRWEQTDDVMQNASVRLIRALKDVPLAKPADFFRVAALQVRRELLDLARHYYGPEGLGRRHVSSADDDDAPEPPPTGGARTTNDPGTLELWERFHQAVEKLPAEEGEVFHLRWYLELDAAEAAKALDISESTVKRRWQAGRRRLHDLLGGELPF
jgi:RNA polymerase sigma factor (sigma-70 family)